MGRTALSHVQLLNLHAAGESSDAVACEVGRFLLFQNCAVNGPQISGRSARARSFLSMLANACFANAVSCQLRDAQLFSSSLALLMLCPAGVFHGLHTSASLSTGGQVVCGAGILPGKVGLFARRFAP